MILYKNKADLQTWLTKPGNKGRSTGFVPTMGALHAGHLSLLRASRAENNITICSIFVNPTQFNDSGDYKKYPVTVENDIMLLESECDVLYLPAIDEMYPKGIKDSKHYDLGFIETVLEGQFRPGHFQGVCNIVDRLLKHVKPGKLYMGQKDYQQCLVISKLLSLTKSSVRLQISPTLREKSGLAMSSRNMRLTDTQKNIATAIYQALLTIKRQLIKGPLSALRIEAIKKLEAQGLRPDYIEIADADTLQPIETWDGKQKIVVLAAASLGEIRLIDNMLIN